jgi:hypothetical protein
MTRTWRSLLAAGLIGAAMPVALAQGAGAAPALAPIVWETQYSGLMVHSSPTIADVDGDGVNDVVVASHDGVVRVFKADGRAARGWPQSVSVVPGFRVGIDAAPTVADLDRDGSAEVVIGAGLLRDPRQHGGVVVFNRNGTTRWRFRTQDRRAGADGYSDAVFGAPAVGDVTGDGYPEVVFGSYDHHIYVLDRHGRNVPGSPFYNEDTVWSSPALADVDGDGGVEVFIGTDQSPGGQEDVRGGQVRSLSFKGGTLTQRWVRNVGEVVISSPALGDIDGDGRLEVVFGTGDYWKTPDSNRVFAINVEDGSDAPGWPQATSGHGWSSPALGDLDGDGRLDVAIMTRGGLLSAWKGNGSRLWVVNPAGGTSLLSWTGTGGPVIADVNGDGRNEVVAASGNGVFARAGRTGALVGILAQPWHHENSPAIGKFGKQWGVVAAGYFESPNRFHVAVHGIPTPKVAPPWPMFGRSADHASLAGAPLALGGKAGYRVLDVRGDIFHFGNAVPKGSIAQARARNPQIGAVPSRSIVSTPSGQGYWALDAVGGIYSFGDARFFGSVPGLRARGIPIGQAEVVGLAPTPSGKGYWLLDDQGGMFAFGDAKFFGSVPGLRARGTAIGYARLVAMAPTPSGRGYWLLDDQGGMFAFGDAKFFGSVPGLRARGIGVGPAQIVGMAPTASGNGYWLVDSAGGLFAFGDARYYGSVPALRAQGRAGHAPAAAMTPTRSGRGYWILDVSGRVYAFGDAPNYGSLSDRGVSSQAVGLART